AFVGVGCGIMDQFASALGRRDHALRIDCRSQAVTHVPLPRDRVRILIVHSGVRRALAQGGYVERRDACRAAAAEARAAGMPVDALRDLGEGDLPALERILAPVLLRRARHVIRENARVERFCADLAAGDLAACGARLREGMRSLREDFEVSTPELDALCELGDAQPGVYGSRLTGAGFGGCTLHLVEAQAVETAAAGIAGGFEARFGRRPPVWVTAASDGAEALAP
ncbi:MAG: galactokinase, partial [Deltaproteobacteria bacterium]